MHRAWKLVSSLSPAGGEGEEEARRKKEKEEEMKREKDILACLTLANLVQVFVKVHLPR